MNTDQQIQQQLNDEYDKFLNEKYKGAVDIPSNIIELFKKAIVVLPPFAHQINFYKIRAIISKNVDELTVGDLTDIIKVILNVPLEKIYSGIDLEFMDILPVIEKCIKMDKFVLSYNAYVDEFQKKLQQKKAVLTDLTRNVHPNGGNMKIVN